MALALFAPWIAARAKSASRPIAWNWLLPTSNDTTAASVRAGRSAKSALAAEARRHRQEELLLARAASLKAGLKFVIDIGKIPIAKAVTTYLIDIQHKNTRYTNGRGHPDHIYHPRFPGHREPMNRTGSAWVHTSTVRVVHALRWRHADRSSVPICVG
jgi:hypothetical protein